MGGNALKDFGIKRLEGNDYCAASTHAEKVLTALLTDFGFTEKARLIPCWREKTSHGDVDVILPATLQEKVNRDKLIAELARRFGCNVSAKGNGPILSVTAPHPEGGFYQLDLIFVREESLDFAQSFYSWGDVSTLLMRLATNMQVSIGLNGLSYNVKNGKTVLGRVMLTRDFKTALEYLHLDYGRWEEGFDNLTQVYEWFSASDAYSGHSFELDRLNPRVQKDVQKRPGYMAFLEWQKEHPEASKRYHWKSYVEGLHEHLWKNFPEAKAEYDVFFEDIARKKAAQEKFNGHMIAEVTGLLGRELGEFIVRFKAGRSEHEFQAYVLNSTSEDLLRDLNVFIEANKVV
jgi:hypothetical protein